jgi:hypothetical protein
LAYPSLLRFMICLARESQTAAGGVILDAARKLSVRNAPYCGSILLANTNHSLTEECCASLDIFHTGPIDREIGPTTLAPRRSVTYV